ncbi:hypothetical protein CAP31_03695 [Sulfuriferula sp. AH1]|nr:hypothetical protein CAP31_03695 [Sulfuriferula sp. AH1]
MIKPSIINTDPLNQWQQEMFDAFNAAASTEASASHHLQQNCEFQRLPAVKIAGSIRGWQHLAGYFRSFFQKMWRGLHG